jgi:hypothetical protein
MLKNIIIFTILALVSFVAWSPAYADLNSGLVAYYPFNGNANDESGNNNTGTVTGAVLTSDRSGAPNSAYFFNGTSAYIRVPNNQSFDVTPAGFTVASWFKADPSQPDPTGIYDLIDKSHGSNGSYDDHAGWAVQFFNGGGTHFAVGTGTSFPWQTADSTGPILDNTWHHISGTFQGSTIKIYIDGVLKSTVTLSPGETPLSNTRDLFIGRHYALGRYFRGTIDEVRIYNRALSDSEIALLGSVESGGVCTQPPAGMIGWWNGDLTANDSVGGHNGTLAGGATFAQGKVGPAFSFGSAGDMVTIPHNTSLNLESLPASSFEGWFKSNGGSDFGDALIIGKHTCGYPNGWFFTTTQGCSLGNIAIGGYGVGNLNLDDGQFHHFACVKNGTLYREFVDGVLIGESTGPSAGTPTNEPVTIGSIISGGSICGPSTHQLFGVADELALYDRALTEDEVRAIYLTGAAGKCKVITVAVDIKPGSFPNSINPLNKGVIPVAILSNASFDAAKVDPATVRFGVTGNEAAPRHSALEDVNGDGKPDLVLQFPTQNTGIVCGTTSGILTVTTIGGQAITGTDSMVTVGCK